MKENQNTRASVTTPDGQTVQLEYMPCGNLRCEGCFEGAREKGASQEDLKKTRKRKENPRGHGPYYRVYSRVGGRFTGRTIRRDEEAELEAEVGETIFELRPKRWQSWKEQQEREEQHNRSSTPRGPVPGRPRNTRKRASAESEERAAEESEAPVA